MNKNSEIEILYEDNHLIIVNKKSGDIVQGDKTGDMPLSEKIAEYLKEKYNKQGNVFVGVIHRIDRPVSGIVIFAKTSKALARMNYLIEKRKIIKKYWAIVIRKPEKDENILSNYLFKNQDKNKSFIVDKNFKGAQKAELKFTFLASSNNYHLLEIELYTGKHHQIRVQLSSIGSIIKGDLKYGAPRSNKDASISLHSRYIEFEHPINNEILKLTAPLPEDKLWSVFEELTDEI